MILVLVPVLVPVLVLLVVASTGTGIFIGSDSCISINTRTETFTEADYNNFHHSWIPVAQMVKARDGHTCKGRRIERRAKSGTFNRDSQTASKRIIFRLLPLQIPIAERQTMHGVQLRKIKSRYW